MGWNQQVVVAQQVIIVGDKSGLFVYNGTPAAGNPPIFSASAGTADPYGNTVIPAAQIQGGGKLTVGTAGGPEMTLLSDADLAITTSIAGGSAASNVTSFSNLQQVIEFPSNNSAETSPPIMGQTLITYTNGETADAILMLSGITASATPDGSFQLTIQQSSAQTYDSAVIQGIYKLASGTITLEPATFNDTGLGVSGVYGVLDDFGPSGFPAFVIGGFGDTNLLPASGNYESWHSLSAGNSWTGTVYYKMTPDNEVYLWSNNLTAPASAANGVTIVTLPPGYRPNVAMTFMVGAQANSGAWPRLTLAMDGTVQSTGVLDNSGVTLGIRVPLDLP